MSRYELALSYERSRWRARGEGLDLVHQELRGIEALIEEQLAGERASVAVDLRFDMSTLPRWLRQYHGHYCNYTLHVPARRARA